MSQILEKAVLIILALVIVGLFIAVATDVLRDTQTDYISHIKKYENY